jgi:hypothetical protein
MIVYGLQLSLKQPTGCDQIGVPPGIIIITIVVWLLSLLNWHLQIIGKKVIPVNIMKITIDDEL